MVFTAELGNLGSTVFVSSAGGHLAELDVLARGLSTAPDPLWVTADLPQTRGLLEDRRRSFVRYVPPRDIYGTLRAIPQLMPLISGPDVDTVVTTGAAVGVSAMIAARLSGKRAIFIESAARFAGPSLSGRLTEWIGGVERYTQGSAWQRRGWKAGPTVFDSQLSATDRRVPRTLDQPLKVLVTLGTIRPYRFDALIDQIVKVVPADAEITWQLGVTTRPDLPGDVHTNLDPKSLDTIARQADVVIAQAGVGTVMMLLENGIYPLIVPRRHSRGEHVDDHQVGLAEMLADRNLALMREADAVSTEDLTFVASLNRPQAARPAQ